MTQPEALIRCMGGNHCQHAAGTCTATNEAYRAKAQAAQDAAIVDALVTGTGVTMTHIPTSDIFISASDIYTTSQPISFTLFAQTPEAIITLRPDGTIEVGTAWANNPDGAARAFVEALLSDYPLMVSHIEERAVKTVLDREAETHRRHDAKVEALEAEIERLNSVIGAAANHWLALQGTNPIAWEGAIDGAMAAACAEIERLRAVLKFYADWGVVSPGYDDAVHIDSGDMARDALATLRETNDA